MCMSYSGIHFNIGYHKRRIRQSLAVNCAGVWLHSCFQLFLGYFRRNKRKVNSHIPHCLIKQVERTAINSITAHHMISGFTDIQYGKENGRHTRGCCQTANAAFQCCYLVFYSSDSRVADAGIKISVILQIKQAAHLFRTVIMKSGALYNWQNLRFPAFGGITGMNAQGIQLIRIAHFKHSSSLISFAKEKRQIWKQTGSSAIPLPHPSEAQPQ